MKKQVIGIVIVLASALAAAEDQAVVDRYNKSCISCHASGVANAPRTGSASDWQPRLAKGMERLILSVKNGVGAMPPRGMCQDCSAADYQALIEFMATPKKK